MREYKRHVVIFVIPFANDRQRLARARLCVSVVNCTVTIQWKLHSQIGNNSVRVNVCWWPVFYWFNTKQIFNIVLLFACSHKCIGRCAWTKSQVVIRIQYSEDSNIWNDIAFFPSQIRFSTYFKQFELKGIFVNIFLYQLFGNIPNFHYAFIIFFYPPNTWISQQLYVHIIMTSHDLLCSILLSWFEKERYGLWEEGGKSFRIVKRNY